MLDTVRADAVSAYGEVADTTPALDALARDGLLYEHAYANANWTLPSHASLFTGLLPVQHGARGVGDALGEVPTLAARLQQAGYETAAIKENPWLSPESGLLRGFAHTAGPGGDTIALVRDWQAARDPARPFFLFVNLMDAHSPYRVRAQNPFLPAGVSAAAARATSQFVGDYLCRAGPDDPALAILRGLYLGNVRAADDKLRAVLDVLEPLRRERPLVVIVTSDHGELFGEHRLVEHEIGVQNGLLHVPLVVHGLPGVAPARIAAPVQLLDVPPSVLAWAGAAAPAGLPGAVLPTVPGAAAPRHIIGEYYDRNAHLEETLTPEVRRARAAVLGRKWQHCGPDARIAGDMRALLAYPLKLLWYEQYPPQLFDIAADPAERHDLAAARPQELAALQEALEAVTRPAAAAAPTAVRQQLDPADVERLRALGYLGGADPGAAGR